MDIYNLNGLKQLRLLFKVLNENLAYVL